MFGLGMSEMILLGVIALVVIGPKELPALARTLGRFINELKRSTESLTDEIKQQANIDLDLLNQNRHTQNYHQEAVSVVGEEPPLEPEQLELPQEDIQEEKKDDQS